MLSPPVIALFVLMALCAVVGAIYAYLYFTRINPAKGLRAAGGAPGSAGHGGGGAGDAHGRRSIATVSVDDDQPGAPSTHLFLFRK